MMTEAGVRKMLEEHVAESEGLKAEFYATFSPHTEDLADRIRRLDARIAVLESVLGPPAKGKVKSVHAPHIRFDELESCEDRFAEDEPKW